MELIISDPPRANSPARLRWGEYWLEAVGRETPDFFILDVRSEMLYVMSLLRLFSGRKNHGTTRIMPRAITAEVR